ncbi:hypothetical protein GUITHDRAFT_165470 [Guillardia theta CCMP2712]|uniref:PAS domain-containing protein n=2 Tax=Guillardia theta TaxID=55529 RepID=L1INU2_GUITC|nr:hypothetical protein GUITHDRAFT_165470 [Guillardia theta CCMP2712]EKX37554.1 hypothetical protein GUITHDRAFT_165470 [Guillardia theta CCMP2712]|mmetsp:Transcript_16117/g.54029  ORF Transcript_16117/g.54029 Transcript_16117/m.54029 type:complete len:263 (+) Transcript_16117:194-982(+)|eukprot:XP_005824534.1 hypothetical protein GUITHDRAFT_165470 [Guillardia theta CCMP2712]
MAVEFEQGDFTKLDLIPPSNYDDTNTSIFFAIKPNTKNVLKGANDEESSAKQITVDSTTCSDAHHEGSQGEGCEISVNTSFPFHIKSASSNWLETFGFAEGEIVGKTIRLCHGPDTNTNVFNSFVQDPSHVGERATITLYHKSGDDVVVSMCPTRSTQSCVTLGMEVVATGSADDGKDEEESKEEMLQKFQDYSLQRAQSLQPERKSKSQDWFPISHTEVAKSSGNSHSHEAEFIDAACIAHVRALRRSKKESRGDKKDSSL